MALARRASFLGTPVLVQRHAVPPVRGTGIGLPVGDPLAFVQAPVEIVFVTFLMGRTIGRFSTPIWT